MPDLTFRPDDWIVTTEARIAEPIRGPFRYWGDWSRVSGGLKVRSIALVIPRSASGGISRLDGMLDDALDGLDLGDYELVRSRPVPTGDRTRRNQLAPDLFRPRLEDALPPWWDPADLEQFAALFLQVPVPEFGSPPSAWTPLREVAGISAGAVLINQYWPGPPEVGLLVFTLAGGGLIVSALGAALQRLEGTKMFGPMFEELGLRLRDAVRRRFDRDGNHAAQHGEENELPDHESDR